MKTLFDIGKTGSIRNGILVSTNYAGRHGTIRVIKFNKLCISQIDSFQANFEIEGGRGWRGAQEDPNLIPADRQHEPDIRDSVTTYLPFRMEDLDVVSTVNGSRFLSAKNGAIAPEAGYWTISNIPVCEEAVVVTDYKELAEYLPHALKLIGVPNEDLKAIAASILQKVLDM